MCFPHDGAARDQLLEVMLSWKDAERKPHVPEQLRRIQINWLKIADIFHLYCDLVRSDQRWRDQDNPSIGKAISLVAASAKRRGARESTLWKIWAEYKDVAHLATAASAVCAEVRHRHRNEQIPHLEIGAQQINPFQMTMLMPDLVLAVAMDFQRIGLANDLENKIEPVLDPETVWRIPADLNVEPLTPPVRKLTQKDILTLRLRRAGNRGLANQD